MSRFVAAGFGLGFAPFAPGTVASAAAVVAGYFLLSAGVPVLVVAVQATVALGFFAIARARVSGDPGWVVIDEVAGQLIAVVAIPPGSAAWALAAFALFRVLDIAKPGPVGWADRLPGTVGIMLDDIFAGAIAAVLLAAVRAAMSGG